MEFIIVLIVLVWCLSIPLLLLSIQSKVGDLRMDLDWLRARLGDREPGAGAEASALFVETQSAPVPPAPPPREAGDERLASPLASPAASPVPSFSPMAERAEVTVPGIESTPLVVPPAPPLRPLLVVPTPAELEGGGDAPDRAGSSSESVETAIGQRWLVRIGALVLVVGVALLYVHAVQQGWVTEVQRTISGAIAGVGVFALGIRFNRRGYAALAQGFVGCGSSLLLLDAFMAHHLYQLVDAPLAVAAMTLVTAVTSIVAYRWSAMPLLLLAQIGGYLTPFMVSSLAADPNVGFAYVFVIDAGMLAVAGVKRWVPVQIVAAVATPVLFMLTMGGGNHTAPAVAMSWAAAYDLLFICILIAPTLWKREAMSAIARAVVPLATFGVAVLGWDVLHRDHPVALAWTLAGTAAWRVALAEWMNRRVPLDATGREILRGCAAAFLLVGARCPFGLAATTLAFAALGVAFATAARARGSVAFRGAAAIALVVSIGSVLANHVHGDGILDGVQAFWNADFGVSLAVVAALVLSALGAPRDLRWIAGSAAVVLGAVVLSGEVAMALAEGVADLEVRRAMVTMSRTVMAIGVAVGFADAARRTGRYATLFLALLHAGLSVLGSLVLLRWLQHPPRLLILNPMCLGALMVPLGLGVIVRFARDERLPARRVVAVAAGVIALALPLIVLSLEAYRFFEAHAGGGDAPVKAASAAVSVTWALYAATVLALGISFRNRAMRLGALFLLATTLCKVVFSDFSELDRLARIVSFIALGVVLMIGAWAYHRFASRIFPEKRA